MNRDRSEISCRTAGDRLKTRASERAIASTAHFSRWRIDWPFPHLLTRVADPAGAGAALADCSPDLRVKGMRSVFRLGIYYNPTAAEFPAGYGCSQSSRRCAATGWSGLGTCAGTLGSGGSGWSESDDAKGARALHWGRLAFRWSRSMIHSTPGAGTKRHLRSEPAMTSK